LDGARHTFAYISSYAPSSYACFLCDVISLLSFAILQHQQRTPTETQSWQLDYCKATHLLSVGSRTSILLLSAGSAIYTVGGGRGTDIIDPKAFLLDCCLSCRACWTLSGRSAGANFCHRITAYHVSHSPAGTFRCPFRCIFTQVNVLMDMQVRFIGL